MVGPGAVNLVWVPVTGGDGLPDPIASAAACKPAVRPGSLGDSPLVNALTVAPSLHAALEPPQAGQGVSLRGIP